MEAKSSVLNVNGRAASTASPTRILDITGEICPMTFVRTRLALDRLSPGETVLVKLRGAEPARNVPRTAMEHGHAVLAISTDEAGISEVLIRRGG